MNSLYLIIKYAFLGLVQGITEPLPISSSGHLVIMEHLLGLKIEGLSFEVLMNFASLLAILYAFREELYRMTLNGWDYVRHQTPSSKADFYLILYVIAGTIPVGIIGVLFKDQIENFFKGLTVIGFALIITGAALWLIRNLRGYKGEQQLTFKDSLLVGLSQAVALIPGISRSGATIVTSLAIGMNRETAFRFSFLLYLPVSLGGVIMSWGDFTNTADGSQMIVPYIVSFIISVLATYFALQWFKQVVLKGKLGYFTLYCITMGILVILAAQL